ncbi:endolytic transglycosylase MltG [Candidatus Shapirobacteria bacterium]|nr:endolytic transglycosylase MltG [Candidatus Shapirobacteria bacterium]
MKRWFILVLALFFIFCTGIFWSYTNSLPLSSDNTVKDFVVNQGDGADEISARLQKNKLIRNQYIFLLIARQMGLNNKLKAGQFRLSANLTPSQIITKLTQGGSQDYWFKIIEGSRIEEVASNLPVELKTSRPEFLADVKNHEGYLYPDSYLIPESYTTPQVLTVIQKNFDKKLAEAKAGATNTQMSDSEIVTFASLLEREGRSLKSKQEIAGVLLNRLEIGMALQIDATVQYAKDSKFTQKDYWLPISKADLSINSPFNTYLNPGLPPSPICSPGYNSLFATYHPITSDYLFYITGNDGLMHYAKTLDEHNQNIAKYLK